MCLFLVIFLFCLVFFMFYTLCYLKHIFFAFILYRLLNEYIMLLFILVLTFKFPSIFNRYASNYSIWVKYFFMCSYLTQELRWFPFHLHSYLNTCASWSLAKPHFGFIVHDYIWNVVLPLSLIVKYWAVP